MAAAYGQLGERDAAGKALRDLLKLRPDFAATVRKDIEKWWEPEYVERLIDGLRKAGLDVPPSVQRPQQAAEKGCRRRVYGLLRTAAMKGRFGRFSFTSEAPRAGSPAALTRAAPHLFQQPARPRNRASRRFASGECRA